MHRQRADRELVVGRRCGVPGERRGQERDERDDEQSGGAAGRDGRTCQERDERGQQDDEHEGGALGQLTHVAGQLTAAHDLARRYAEDVGDREDQGGGGAGGPDGGDPGGATEVADGLRVEHPPRRGEKDRGTEQHTDGERAAGLHDEARDGQAPAGQRAGVGQPRDHLLAQRTTGETRDDHRDDTRGGRGRRDVRPLPTHGRREVVRHPRSRRERRGAPVDGTRRDGSGARSEEGSSWRRRSLSGMYGQRGPSHLIHPSPAPCGDCPIRGSTSFLHGLPHRPATTKPASGPGT